MTSPLTVPASLRTIWVFRVDLPEPALEAFQEDGPDDSLSPLAAAVGTGWLDRDYIELFDAATLCDYGLARYLSEANGMDPASVDPDADQLDSLTGPVLLIFSAALIEGTQHLAPSAPLALIGRYSEKADYSIAPPLRSDAATGVIGSPPTNPTPQGRPGSIASVALLALIVVVGAVIWASLR